MTLPWREHPAATAELLDAIRYYQGQQPGLGREFDTEVTRAIEGIQWRPEAWPAFPGWDRLPVVRTHKVDVFPSRVVCFLRDEEIVIVAYAATARRPGYWKQRLED